MSVTVKKILEKYPTSLDIDSMDEKLLNWEFSEINLEDITQAEEYKQDNGNMSYVFRTNKNYLATIKQNSIGETWKDEFGYIHTFHLNEGGDIIST